MKQFMKIKHEKSAEGIVLLCLETSKGRPELVKPE